MRWTTVRSALATLLVVSAFIAPTALAQQQTGSIIFEVKDTEGKPLQGVAITLEGPKLLGTQLRETDALGRARFPLLPPGTVNARFDIAGYISIGREIDIGLGTGQLERVTLTKGEITETVEVTAEQPIDPTETNTSAVYTAEVFQKTQLGSGSRSYQDLVQRTAGVGGGANPSVHGGTLGENVYLIDGVNTTDPVTGTFGLNTNFDIIDQVEVLTGGFQAEYGSATGGIINQVTKSGGNEVHGAFDVRYRNENFIADAAHFDNDQPQDFRNAEFTIGGPIKKDSLWYQLSLGYTLTQILPAGANATREYDGLQYTGKLTWQINPDHRLAFQYTADPAEISADNADPLVAAEASNFQEQGGSFTKATYWGRVDDHWNVTGQVAWYATELNTFPLNDTGVPSLTNLSTGYLSMNYNDAQFSERKRTQTAWNAEYVTHSQRWHAIKFGFDIQDTSFTFHREQPGNAEDSIWSDLFPAPLERDILIAAGEAEDTGLETAFFVQDSWHATSKITFDLGLRWDRSRFERDDKVEVLDLSLLQPRLGAAFDLRGDAKDVITVSLARYMHPNILSIPQAVNAHADQTDVYYWENNPAWGEIFGAPGLPGVDWDGDTMLEDEYIYVGSFGGPSGSSVAEGTDATYVDEFVLGYKHLLKPNMTFAARFVNRDTKDIIEDTYDDATGAYVIYNFPGLKRRYNGLELEYKWDAKRWHVNANWTISQAKGNIEYTQGLGTDYDLLPQHAENRYGYLSYDRKHRVKVYGWVDLPKKWTIGYDLFYGSGLPYDRVENLTGEDPPGRQLYGQRFLEARGSQRLPSTMTLDTSVRKAFGFGKDNEVTLLGTVTNLLGANHVTAVNEVDDGTAMSQWGTPTAYQDPRTWEVGVRLTF